MLENNVILTPRIMAKKISDLKKYNKLLNNQEFIRMQMNETLSYKEQKKAQNHIVDVQPRKSMIQTQSNNTILNHKLYLKKVIAMQ